jgi:hypothetical protein
MSTQFWPGAAIRASQRLVHSPSGTVSVYAGKKNIGLIPKLLLSILLVFAVMVGSGHAIQP